MEDYECSNRKNLLHDIPVHVRQAEVAALVFVGQAGVVDSQAAQNRRLQIVDMDGVSRDVVAEVVGFADRQAGLDAAAS